MATLALLFALMSGPYRNVNTCETYAPRLDGTQVTVCGGKVVKVEYVGRVGVR